MKTSALTLCCALFVAFYTCALADECTSYETLDDATRLDSYTGGQVTCDQWDFEKNWYRFTGASGEHIADSCPPINHCRAHATGWMTGQHPTIEEGIVTRQVCYHWGEDCCTWQNNIRIRQCAGGFYVYELDKPPQCNLRYCSSGSDLDPVDGGWSNWGEWGECDTPCDEGGGERFRTRACTNPPPSNGGAECAGDDKESQECRVNGCSDGPECTSYKTLDDATRLDSYSGGEATCDQSGFEKGWYRFDGASGKHMADSCPPKNHCRAHATGWVNGKHPTVEEGIVTRQVCYNWGDDCCTWENNIRILQCAAGFFVYELDKTPQCYLRYCSSGSGLSGEVNGGWSDWTDWDECSKSCDGGEQSRRRSCNNPAPENGGKSCSGLRKETRECNSHGCPVAGGWSEFGNWGECSKSCGGGEQERVRTCTKPPPSNGGAECEGLDRESQGCNESPCKDIKVKKLGCYMQGNPKALPEQLKNFKGIFKPSQASKLVNACAKLVKDKGYTHFGIGENQLTCFSGPDAANTYKNGGKGSKKKCTKKGQGKRGAVFVYTLGS